MSQQTLNGKVVAITGGARGIGLATAVVLKSLGATVAIGDVDAEAAGASAADNGLAFHAALDVTERESFSDFLDGVERALGPVDVLVNNAGVIAVGSVVHETDAATKQLLDVNVYGVILGTKLALERMLPRRAGHVVNIASLSSVSPTPGIATYCATKHAVLGFTDSVRLENRGSGVQFSSVMPTLTKTSMIAGTKEVRGLKNAEPEDVARAVASLIARPRRRALVPGVLMPILALQRLVPQPVGEALAKLLGSDHVFADADTAARRDYARRTGTS